MNDVAPLPPEVAPRGRWWLRGLLLLALAATAWVGWRAYDHRAAIREAEAAGFVFRESPTPLAAIRTDWRSALRLDTWTVRERELVLLKGTDLAPLRPLLLRLAPTELTASGSRHLDALRGLTRLRYLALADSDVKDLAPLAGLAQLEVLKLVRCPGVTDLTPLAGLAQLQWLYLDGCSGVADLAPLASLAQLRTLGLTDCTGLGAEAVAAFKKTHPRVTVFAPDGREVQAQ